MPEENRVYETRKDAEAGKTGGTPRTIEGPLYVEGAPLVDNDANLTDDLPWRHEAAFDADLRRAVYEITEATTILLTAALSDLLETAPPRLVGRLASTSRFADRP